MIKEALVESQIIVGGTLKLSVVIFKCFCSKVLSKQNLIP